MTRIHNFNAGPAALPLPALEQAREELLDFQGSGMSIIEHSHRGKDYEGVHMEALGLLRELLSIPESHEVLLLQGGASQQFAMVPMNLLPAGESADYVVTGGWAQKALQEAQLVGAARAAWKETDAAGRYARIPATGDLDLDPRAPPTSTSRRTTPSSARSGSTSPTRAPSPSWPTCPRTSCGGPSTRGASP